MISPEQVPILDRKDIVVARGAARLAAAKIGFGIGDQTRLATAVSELTRNIIEYGGEGCCEIVDASTEQQMRINVKVEDHGPGIKDLDQAMKDGYSTGGSLGAGLPGTRRLMDSFELESRPGLTRVKIAMVRPRTLMSFRERK